MRSTPILHSRIHADSQRALKQPAALQLCVFTHSDLNEQIWKAECYSLETHPSADGDKRPWQNISCSHVKKTSVWRAPRGEDAAEGESEREAPGSRGFTEWLDTFL